MDSLSANDTLLNVANVIRFYWPNASFF